MNLENIKLFCDVVRCRSFSEGAALNSVSQSAASQAVIQMERELNARLIDRSKRPFVLTAEGKICFEVLRDILDNYRILKANISLLRKDMEGVIRVASIYSVGLHSLGGCIQKFMTKYPKAKVKLDYQQPSIVEKAVMDENADIGIISFPNTTRELLATPLCLENMVIACSPEHHLASRKNAPVRMLDGENMIAFDRDLPIRKQIDHYLRENHVSVRTVMEFDNIETIKHAIEISAGISILPEPSIQREIQAGSLAMVSLNGNKKLERPIGIIRRKRKILTPVIEKFIELLQAELGNSLEQDD